MNILLINQDWFAAEFKAAGHNVVSCGINPNLDVDLKVPLVHIDTLLKNELSFFSPDVLFIQDNSAPVVLEGLDASDLPTLFYSVDVHHHLDFHKYLYHVFDYTLVAQKDYIPHFDADDKYIEWMPLWASRYVEASQEKEYGAVFVGTLDEKLNPDRVRFFNELEKKVPILLKMGKYWEIFPFSDIVVNQTVKGDLNFRVFEAMMSGALLLTEDAPNGLYDLFKSDEHLITYQKNNVDDAAEKIQQYLDNTLKAREIAQAGRAEILAKHTPEIRAARALEIINNLTKKKSEYKHYSWAVNYHSLYHRLKKIDTALAHRSLVCCLKAIEQAINLDEKMLEDVVYHVVQACCEYELLDQSGAGGRLLLRLDEACPDTPLIKMARIRNLLNRGEMDEASKLAHKVSCDDVNETFQNAEKVIRSLLDCQSEDFVSDTAN